MKYLQSTNVQTAINPVVLAKSTTATAIAVNSVVANTAYTQARFIITIGVTTAVFSTFKLTECDTSGGSYTDVSGASFGATTPTAGDVYIIDVNMVGRMQYFKLSVIGDATGTAGLSAVCVFGEAGQAPNTNAEWGAVATVGYLHV